MFKSFIKNQTLRFRRFTSKTYAAFCSLHREVTIGCLAAYVADREMLKSGHRLALAFVLLLLAGHIEAADESDTIPITPEQLSLQEVLVTAEKAEVNSSAYRLITSVSRQEIQSLPIQTVADLLQYLPGLDIRTRGANGSQADVSMRGGTFDQVLVMLNGVNLTDAHTGHYSLNLPIDPALIERVEIMQGTSAHLFGLNAFAGAINIVTRLAVQPGVDANHYHARLTAGMNGLVNPALSGSWQRGEWYAKASAEYLRSDGYYAPNPSEKEQKSLTNSDTKLANLYFLTGYKGLEVQLGAQYKDAGAGMFYGFGSQDQFDATRTAFGSATYKHQWGAWGIDLQASYRANYDRYEWHRGQRLYGNFHFTQNAAASLKAHYASRVGRTTAGIEVRNENIHSTNLGDTINPNGQVPNVEGFALKDVRVLNLVRGLNRINVNYFAEQTFHWQGLSASLGVAGNYNNLFGNNFTGGANIGYEYARESSVYLNANRSLRLPTFTDLYYNAGNQLGNRNLKPEEAWVLSVGTQYNKNWQERGRLHVQADAYYRWGKNIIDWVYTAEDTKRPYHAQNWNKVNSAGVEATVQYRWNKWLRLVEASYAYTYLDLDVDKSGSRYLDYLKHKLTLRIDHGLGGDFGASWALRYQERRGEYNNAEGEVHSYKPVVLLDGQVYWDRTCKASVGQDPIRLRIAASCTNMTNRHYYDYGGILQPGAWAKISMEIHL